VREFEAKRRFKRLLYSKLSILLLFLLLLFAGHSTWKLYAKQRQSERKREEVERELAELQAREKLLFREIEDLKSPEGVEREIRDKFRMAKEGEELVVIIEDKSTTTHRTSSKKWWQFWK